jgi:hypothetical protein
MIGPVSGSVKRGKNPRGKNPEMVKTQGARAHAPGQPRGALLLGARVIHDPANAAANKNTAETAV